MSKPVVLVVVSKEGGVIIVWAGHELEEEGVAHVVVEVQAGHVEEHRDDDISRIRSEEIGEHKRSRGAGTAAVVHVHGHRRVRVAGKEVGREALQLTLQSDLYFLLPGLSVGERGKLLRAGLVQSTVLSERSTREDETSGDGGGGE
ncbi:MAG: hypothetical protein ACOC0P_02095 [Planctomycetota bacterium]